MNGKKILRRGFVLLAGPYLLMWSLGGIASAESGYEIKRFRCDQKRKVGEIARLRVEIQNNGSTDPGTVLVVFGIQAGSELLVEEGATVFVEPGEEEEKKFLYSINSGGTITWHASIDGDEALCTTRVRGGEPVLPPGDGDDDDDSEPGPGPIGANIIAMHDSGSRQYEKHCNECHAEVHSRTSLDSAIPAAHVAMMPFAAGKVGEDKQCTWCHRSVDLVQGTQPAGVSKASLSKRVDIRLCAMCHGPSGPGKQFYQASLNLTDGPELYDLTCAACHKPLVDSELRGKPASKIREAIDDNKGGMAPLGVLSDTQITAIAAALEE